MAVVLAANSLGVARPTRADADDGDGGAAQSYQDIQVLDDDAQEAKERGSSRRAGLSYV